ncbi:glycosyltransferase family 1 protein [Agreia sp. COWG]|uniref:glycosyltransferase family 4 protein n=1 Tax=Agreia sp. COWG TaxID=2773266 RepID=UPI001927252D|nr:glycosyltransferase family 1 protein [Agreia sp. COWG]CAD5997908.1 Mannosyltransferase [Agreia sp. COWG]
MRVVFDCRYTRIGRHDGISRYTAGLVTALASEHDVVMLISDLRQLEMLPDIPWHMTSAPTSVREPFVALQVNALAPDVVFSPMQTMGSFGRRYPLALTVHDLIYYSNPTPPRDLAWPIRLVWRLYHLSWWPQRFLLAQADAVVTVSETTRQLIAQNRLTKRPVVVVRNAADPAKTTPEPVDVRSKTLVYMGSFMPYKNVETLVAAAGLLPGYELHLMSRVTDADRRRLEAIAPSARLVFHDGASDEEYTEVVRHATALVTASLEEGFGIPLVEAMAQGTPVITSDIPVFTEIGGDAALYFAAHDANELARQVRRLEDPAVFAEASREGVRQAQKFSWTSSARMLWELLDELAARPRRR